MKRRDDAMIDIQCHICGFLRLEITPYFLDVGELEFYVVAKAYCPSYGSSGQYLGRLVRLKQSKEVTWVMLRVNDTVYDFIEHKACQKEAQAFSEYLIIPEFLDKPLCQKLLSYKVPRAVWSQPFNPGHFYHLKHKEVDDDDSPEKSPGKKRKRGATKDTPSKRSATGRSASIAVDHLMPRVQQTGFGQP
ncbi:hypothetical protein F5883DRAFT_642934 [Diaporthe sp. PMI_573]|nr:hypothetical protein F5883DRAFT_642934 [Diaporthaceae sp. PMI_573]